MCDTGDIFFNKNSYKRLRNWMLKTLIFKAGSKNVHHRNKYFILLSLVSSEIFITEMFILSGK
jgi:hypothetical protein